MTLDIQKAGLGKRMIAFIFDFILLITLAVGIAAAISGIVGYDGLANELTELRNSYSEQYGIELDITGEEYSKLTEEQKAQYSAAENAFTKDPVALMLYGKMMGYMLLMVTIGPILAFLVLEFLVPIFLGNGQTVGKKIFAIGVMYSGGLKLNTFGLFARNMLGKCTIGTMLPLISVVLMMFTNYAPVARVVFFAVLLLNLALFFFTRYKTPIHDLLASTITIDMQSQRIFESREALEAYRQRRLAEAAEAANKSKY